MIQELEKENILTKDLPKFITDTSGIDVVLDQPTLDKIYKQAKREVAYIHANTYFERYKLNHLKYLQRVGKSLDDYRERLGTYKDEIGFDKEENRKSFNKIQQQLDTDSKREIRREVIKQTYELIYLNLYYLEYTTNRAYATKRPLGLEGKLVYDAKDQYTVNYAIDLYKRIEDTKKNDPNAEVSEILDKKERMALGDKATQRKIRNQYARPILKMKADKRFVAKLGFDEGEYPDQETLNKLWYECSDISLSPALRGEQQDDNEDYSTWTVVFDIDAHEGDSNDMNERILSRMKCMRSAENLMLYLKDAPTFIEKSTINGGFHIYYKLSHSVTYKQIKTFCDAFNNTLDPFTEAPIEVRSENKWLRLPLSHSYEKVNLVNFYDFVKDNEDRSKRLVMLYSESFTDSLESLKKSVLRPRQQATYGIIYHNDRLNSKERIEENIEKAESVERQICHIMEKLAGEEKRKQLIEKTATLNTNINYTDIKFTKEQKESSESLIRAICQTINSKTVIDTLYKRIDGLRNVSYREEVDFDINGNIDFENSKFKDFILVKRTAKKEKIKHLPERYSGSSLGGAYGITRYNTIDDILTPKFLEKFALYEGDRYDTMNHMASYLVYLNNEKGANFGYKDFQQAVMACQVDSRDINHWIGSFRFEDNCDNLFDYFVENYDPEKVKKEYRSYDSNLNTKKELNRYISNRSLLTRDQKQKIKQLVYYLVDKECIRRIDVLKKAKKTYYILLLEIFSKLLYEDCFVKKVNPALPMRKNQKNFIESYEPLGMAHADKIEDTFNTYDTYERLKNVLCTFDYIFLQKFTDTNPIGYVANKGHLNHTRQYEVPNLTGTKNNFVNVKLCIDLVHSIVTKDYDKIYRIAHHYAPYKRYLEEHFNAKIKKEPTAENQDDMNIKFILMTERQSFREYSKIVEKFDNDDIIKSCIDSFHNEFKNKTDSKSIVKNYTDYRLEENGGYKIYEDLTKSATESNEKTIVRNYQRYSEITKSNAPIETIVRKLVLDPDSIARISQKHTFSLLFCLYVRYPLLILNDIESHLQTLEHRLNKNLEKNNLYYMSNGEKYKFVSFNHHLNKAVHGVNKYCSFLFLPSEKFATASMSSTEEKTMRDSYRIPYCGKATGMVYNQLSYGCFVSLFDIRDSKKRKEIIENSFSLLNINEENNFKKIITKKKTIIEKNTKYNNLLSLVFSSNSLYHVFQTLYVSSLNCKNNEDLDENNDFEWFFKDRRQI